MHISQILSNVPDGSIMFRLLTLECFCETPEQHCQALPFIGGEGDGEARFRKTVCISITLTMYIHVLSV